VRGYGEDTYLARTSECWGSSLTPTYVGCIEYGQRERIEDDRRGLSKRDTMLGHIGLCFYVIPSDV
jgi:hypothetical protein